MTSARAGKLLGLLPLIILILWLIAYGNSEYPYGDTYTFSARTAIATVDGTLTLDHFLQISNGHRILFSRLVTAILTITTQWDTRLEIVVNVVLACINVVLIVRLIRKFAPSIVPLAWFPIALLLLTVDQMINWVSGVQNLWHFVLFCLLLCLHILTAEHRRRWHMLMIVFWGMFATFSAGNGMVIWACIIGAMLILRYDRRTITLISIIGGVAIIGYLWNSDIGISTRSEVTPYAYWEIGLIQPAKIAEFVLIFIGRPLSNTIQIAPFIGLVGLILFGYALITRQRGVHILAILGIYSLLSALQIAVTRVNHFDVVVGFAERYISISMAFWVGLCGMWFVRLDGKNIPHPLGIIFLICAVHLFALSYQAGRTDINQPVNHAMLEGECVRRFPVTRQPRCDGWIVPDPYITNELAQRRLSGFAREEFVGN